MQKVENEKIPSKFARKNLSRQTVDDIYKEEGERERGGAGERGESIYTDMEH